MKKSFPLHVAAQADARVLEAIKGDVRKYLKRERRKPLKDGVDFWDFNCRVGVDQQEPVACHPEEVINTIDAAAKTEGAASVFVEILAKPGVRVPKPKPVDPLAAAAVGVAGALAATDAAALPGETQPAENPADETPPSSGKTDYIAPSETFDADGDSPH